MNQRRLIYKLFAIMLIISLTLGCNFLTGLVGTPEPNLVLPTLAAPSTPGVSSLSNTSAADLAEQITRDDATLIQSFEAVQEALARGGVATVDVNGVYVAAYLPPSPMPVTHPDVLALTLEARDRENSYRMTMEEFAQALKD